MASDSAPGLLLSGLDGSNPLAFLAAVGALRTATLATSSNEWCLRWTTREGHWTPELRREAPLTPDCLLGLLMPGLKAMKDAPAFRFADNLTVDLQQFRKVAQEAQGASTLEDRRYADFVAAFGCDGLSISDKDRKIQDTALRTMSGAGHQHFLKSMRELVKVTEEAHLRDSLFLLWRYADPRPSLRWDPMDDRRHALRWHDPSDTSRSPVRTMRGANRLAIEALPLLPTAPVGRWLHTTGFSPRRDEGVLFTWPIWDVSLSLDSVRSLLSLPELQESQPRQDRLTAIGVTAVFRSQRITQGKYRNFTHAVPV